ncbi:hypothetical protein EAH73_08915 [Hymenobacter nivis]|uniref:Uncharacterized protein n=1 Tax=Hymenobacter nivis TaxID=1850093 RepID=A0A502GZJ8_9BACT|nr:hypothetical protein EAH73_08915 [Hymenobacter nivis]
MAPAGPPVRLRRQKYFSGKKGLNNPLGAFCNSIWEKHHTILQQYLAKQSTYHTFVLFITH